MAAPTYVTKINGTSGSGTSFALTLSGISVGDFMIAILYKESTAAYTATPSGWTQITGFPSDQSGGGFKYRADAWWKAFATSEPNPTWSWSGATWRSSTLHAYRGVYTTDPIATVGIDVEASQNAAPSNPGITIARADSALLFCWWNFAGAGSTPPTGFADRGDPGIEVNIYDDLTVSTGATGTIAGTSDNDEWPTTALIEVASVAAAGGSTVNIGVIGGGVGRKVIG